MLAVLMRDKIVVLDSTTIVRYDGDATTILIDGKRYIVHASNVMDKIKDALRRGDNFVEVD